MRCRAMIDIGHFGGCGDADEGGFTGVMLAEIGSREREVRSGELVIAKSEGRWACYEVGP